MATATPRKADVLFVASLALAGCNLVSGLDGVNIRGEGEGGSTSDADTTTAPATSTAPGGGGPGLGGAGGDGLGGAGGAASTTSGPEGGGGGHPTTSTTGETTTSTTGTTSTTTSTTTTTTTTTDTGQGGGSPMAECGNGAVVSGEQCDDGNAAGGDGCSADCLVEPFYQCNTAAPSACAKQETACGDGADNDQDGALDAEDTDCILPPYAPANCSTPLVFRSVDPPAPIPDKGGGKRASAVTVPAGFTVVHTGVLLDIAHPRAKDLSVSLLPPFGPPRDLTSHNGGNGADYSLTFLDSDCPTSVISAPAPFAGCYKPEGFLPSSGQQAGGKWVLEIADDAVGQTGTLLGWSLVLCAP